MNDQQTSEDRAWIATTKRDDIQGVRYLLVRVETSRDDFTAEDVEAAIFAASKVPRWSPAPAPLFKSVEVTEVLYGYESQNLWYIPANPDYKRQLCTNRHAPTEKQRKKAKK